MPSSACSRAHRHLPSFPTRRSSDLSHFECNRTCVLARSAALAFAPFALAVEIGRRRDEAALHHALDDLLNQILELLAGPFLIAVGRDRKSTRLNSSHLGSSYAVFCLLPRPPTSTLFPYTTLFRSQSLRM